MQKLVVVVQFLGFDGMETGLVQMFLCGLPFLIVSFVIHNLIYFPFLELATLPTNSKQIAFRSCMVLKHSSVL